MEEDWDLLRSFFPEDWRGLAKTTGATKGLRQDKDEELLLRTLLLHVGCGYSLRETATRATQGGWAVLSDVAVLKRLRKSEKWLQSLCTALFKERELSQPALEQTGCLRLVDATQIKEPGKTGSLWCIHYSVRVPSMECDYFEITPLKGLGNGESLKRFDARPGEHLLADRGYCTAQGMHHILQQGSDVTVRLNPGTVHVLSAQGEVFPLEERLREITKTHQTGEWKVVITDKDGGHRVPGRLCVVRKSKAAIAQTRKRLRRKAAKSYRNVAESTWFYAEYVLVFTTVSASRLNAQGVLDLYRFRWQIELVFKRFKQLADLGHLPKHDPASSRAWLYGKLFVALLTEKLIAQATAFSPWGY